MPKIIENIREKLLTEARRQVAENGYSSLTVRSVAAGCSVGTGTVYNYFPSKDMLVASFLLEDWQECLEAMRKCSLSGTDAKSVISCIYSELCRFTSAHSNIFNDKNALRSFNAAFADRHSLLRNQLAEIVMPLCRKNNAGHDEFISEFIAESVLTWTIAGRSFDEIYYAVSKLL